MSKGTRMEYTLRLGPIAVGRIVAEKHDHSRSASSHGDSSSSGSNLLPASRALLDRIQPDMIVGDYELQERIGIGGMGVVHRALHIEGGESVAIKFLISGDASHVEGERLRQVEQEARIISHLDHPSIVKVRGIHSDAELDYMVMDLFLGPHDHPVNLADYSRSFGNADGMLDEEDLKQIMTVLLDAIDYAHCHGVVHCDLKPANILFQCVGSEDDHWLAHLKLTDFGLAKIIGEDVIFSSVSQSLDRAGDPAAITDDVNALLGTYEYMSPEQRRGEPATAVSDLYSVGMMMFRLLTGSREPGLKRPSKLRLGVNAEWDGVILKALQEPREKRFQTAAEMSAAIEAIEPATAGV